jgi:uncharacterized membrane protein
MNLLQDVSQKLPNAAPDATFGLWMISQVLVTLIVFIGVYYIFKPVLGKKDNDDKNEESNDQ